MKGWTTRLITLCLVLATLASMLVVPVGAEEGTAPQEEAEYGFLELQARALAGPAMTRKTEWFETRFRQSGKAQYRKVKMQRCDWTKCPFGTRKLGQYDGVEKRGDEWYNTLAAIFR